MLRTWIVSVTAGAAALIFVVVPTCRAATIRVPDDQPSIQAGIDAASPGDTVLVACGTYFEHDIMMKSGVCLRSETGQADCATIDAEALGRVMYCNSLDETTTIEGFLLSNGFIVGAGAGVHCSSGSPAFSNCTLKSNLTQNDAWSPAMGGGMHLEGSSPVLVGCEFSDNSALYGGGLSCTAGSSPSLVSCTFSGNTGGGVHLTESSPELTNCIIAFNTDAEAVHTFGASSAVLTCCDVFGNELGDWVGCISGQDGANGNMHQDPLFCDWEQLDLGIAENSPCAAENNPGCGLVGAHDVTCGVVVPLPGQIAVSEELLELGGACQGGTSTTSLLVSNVGEGWLVAFDIGCDHPDFSTSPMGMAVPPGDSASVQVEFTPSSNGTATGTLTIACNDPEHPVVEIPVEGEGLGPVQIAVSDTLLQFGQVCVGSSVHDPIPVTVINAGPCPLVVSDIETDHGDFSPSLVGFTLPPGNTQDVYVEFSPSVVGLITGTLTVESNDPDDPVVEIALEGEGLEGGHIAASDTLISFGTVAIGGARWDYVVVENTGCELLTVSDISIGHEDFSVNTTGFSLEPYFYQEVAVGFAPSTSGPITATMTILSNDPDDPTLAIALEGEGVVSPEIVVTPDSLHADLPVGGTETHHFIIENIGGSELVWSARAVSRRRAPAADLEGVDILWDQFHGQTTGTHSMAVDQLESRGATVTESDVRISNTLLNEFDVAWITDCPDSFCYTEVAALAAWVAEGGGLLLEGEDDSSVETYNEILSSLGAGIRYSVINGTHGLTTNVHPHQMTHGVDYVHLWYPKAHLSSVALPALPLIDDRAGVPNSACEQAGFGRVVTMAGDLANNFHFTYGNTEVLVSQVFDWLAMGTACGWLSCAPAAGTVQVGGSAEVGVTFDAAELHGGDYLADVQVHSNDVDDRWTYVAAGLHVTGVPDIAVSPTQLNFGEVAIGATAAETLLVWNEGTDLLTVGNISSDHTEFAAQPASFILLPEEDQAVVIQFTPIAEGPVMGTLTILSDDPDEGTVLVTLEGTGMPTTPVEYSLLAEETELGTVMIRWTVPSLVGIDGFSVYRGTSQDGPFARVSEHVIAPSTTGCFEDASVWPETTFWYELRAVLATGTEEVVDGSPTSVTTGGRLAAALYPARPNPFTGVTRMHVDIPNGAELVHLAVYNVRGQLVRQLIDSPLGRGRREVVWDGADGSGRQVPAGVYLVRLETGEVSRTQKVAVVR
jgi:hypothetical protein